MLNSAWHKWAPNKRRIISMHVGWDNMTPYAAVECWTGKFRIEHTRVDIKQADLESLKNTKAGPLALCIMPPTPCTTFVQTDQGCRFAANSI